MVRGKCHSQLHDCRGCNGGRGSGMSGDLTCSRCNATGLVCSEHGAHSKYAFTQSALSKL